jgi:hypothetical protein
MRFVTTLTQNYIPGLQALWNSLERNSQLTDIKFTVVQYDDARADGPFDTEYIPLSDLGTINYNPKLCTDKRHIANLYKFAVWNIPHDEVCCYLDADIICLNPLTGIEQLQPMSVVVNHNQIGRVKGYDKQYRVKNWVWNAGWFIYRPSVDTFNAIEAHALIKPKPIKYGDQPIHVEYFDGKPDLRYVSMTWNTSIWIYRTHPYLWHTEDIKLLHYADDWKPWLAPPRQPWMEKLLPLWNSYAPGIPGTQ